jgi:hypothetical protein
MSLIEMGKDPEKCHALGDSAQMYVKAHFDFSVIGSQYESLYTDMLANRILRTV